MTASSSIQYARSLPLLAQRFRAIALDTPGFGASDPLPAEPTIPAYAAALAEFLDALGLEQVDVVGFHTGSSIGLELAVSRPERVRRVILAGILAVESEDEAQKWSDLILRSWQPDGRGEFLEEIRWWMPAYVSEDDGDSYLNEVISRLQAGPDYLLAPSAVIAHDALAALARLEQPTLVLAPAEDNLVEETRRAHAAAPGSSFLEIPGNDGAAWDHPREFADAIVGFLS